MSRLETEVQPILTPMIQGEATALDAQQQRQVAEWVALKVMIADHAKSDDYVISKADRYAFRNIRRIPSGFEVRLGRCGQERWNSCFFRVAAFRGEQTHTLRIAPPKNIQSVTFGIGELLIFAFVSPDPTITTSNKISPLLPLLWPSHHAEFSWPPESVLSAAQADNLAHSLEQLMNYPGHGRLPLWRV
jgi:hypothetical protein